MCFIEIRSMFHVANKYTRELQICRTRGPSPFRSKKLTWNFKKVFHGPCPNACLYLVAILARAVLLKERASPDVSCENGSVSIRLLGEKQKAEEQKTAEEELGLDITQEFSGPLRESCFSYSRS